MVAVIKTSTSIARSFRYNEQKVNQGVAQCIMAANYPCEPQDLTPKQRLNMLLRFADLNDNVKRNSIHISLNFHPDDVVPPKLLTRIAQTYMNQLGFGQQPYLVYQHHDASHTHIHIVSVVIRPDGTRIATHNNAKDLSELARKSIELQFGLTQASAAGQRKQYLLDRPGAQKAIHGKIATKRTIWRVLRTVLPQYTYGSFPELRALLSLYNVGILQPGLATPGKATGLRYVILNEKGKKVGVPIKASTFENKPTHHYLQERFATGQTNFTKSVSRVKSCVDFAMRKAAGQGTQALTQLLEKEGIQMVFLPDSHSETGGIIYVDFRTKFALSASKIGAAYHRSQIQEMCQPSGQPLSVDNQTQAVQHQSVLREYLSKPYDHRVDLGPAPAIESAVSDALLRPMEDKSAGPWQLRRSRKKRKKKLSQQL
ncbi:relaxase/mobilization nuclease domain-containing protein [Dyadobacter sp. CY343]|uniref:relaxase/mobilization nuclease domain-containing protein n=1 Tax=Dyadobacter sp. CY343 TaxID=2907299 RepID=UPI001F2577E3|nr:relaxase/mobilization nuclease domain-containing protein [Dyadobacter sp. CY343]MCE7059726.1 relaxase/mobilization nuclease domain-containing protein [Dyadobacter sp. CY343]